MKMHSRQLARIHEGLVVAVEPNIREIVNEEFSLTSFDEAIEAVDIAVLLVYHKESKEEKTPRTTYVVDTKGIWK